MGLQLSYYPLRKSAFVGDGEGGEGEDSYHKTNF